MGTQISQKLNDVDDYLCQQDKGRNIEVRQISQQPEKKSNRNNMSNITIPRSPTVIRQQNLSHPNMSRNSQLIEQNDNSLEIDNMFMSAPTSILHNKIRLQNSTSNLNFILSQFDESPEFNNWVGERE